MTQNLILASGSEIRRQLLEKAGVNLTVQKARIDEEMIRQSLLADQASPRDVADALAEMKARKVSEKNPDAFVIGCDQVLDFDGEILSKPNTVEEAQHQLTRLRGKRHSLLSAAVICQDGKPIWRHIGQVRLQMRGFTDAYMHAYLQRNWPSISYSVGGYKLEEEGIRLFSRVDGDYFSVLGLPMIELLSYLTVRGVIEQ